MTDLKTEDWPASVLFWVRALMGEIPWEHVRAYLIPTVTHNIAGRVTRGAEQIVAMMQSRGEALVGTNWTLLPSDNAQSRTVRGSIPGKMLPSAGGPMSAIDFELVLQADGLIAEIRPRPHHLEPVDLQQALKIGARPPPIELYTLEGAVVPVNLAAGSPMLIVFTSNHCPWALGWHDRLQVVARTYEPRGLRTIQVNPNDALVSPADAPLRTQQRVARGEFATPLLIDRGQRLARLWGARHTPEIFLFNKSGTLSYHGAPDADFQDNSQAARWLTSALDATLAGVPVPQPSTTPVGCTIKWTL